MIVLFNYQLFCCLWNMTINDRILLNYYKNIIEI